MIELTFLKELMLIRQANQKSTTFVAFVHQMSASDAMILMSLNLSDVAILNTKGADYCYIIS